MIHLERIANLVMDPLEKEVNMIQAMIHLEGEVNLVIAQEKVANMILTMILLEGEVNLVMDLKEKAVNMTLKLMDYHQEKSTLLFMRQRVYQKGTSLESQIHMQLYLMMMTRKRLQLLRIVRILSGIMRQIYL